MAALIAALGSVLLVTVEANSASGAFRDDGIIAAADLARLQNYLVEVTGSKPPSASPHVGGASARDITRLRDYLADVTSATGRPRQIVAQGNNDDLLTPQTSPTPAPSGSNKPAGDDLLTPAPSGGDLLTPAPGGSDLLTPGANIPQTR